MRRGDGKRPQRYVLASARGEVKPEFWTVDLFAVFSEVIFRLQNGYVCLHNCAIHTALLAVSGQVAASRLRGAARILFLRGGGWI